MSTLFDHPDGLAATLFDDPDGIVATLLDDPDGLVATLVELDPPIGTPFLIDDTEVGIDSEDYTITDEYK